VDIILIVGSGGFGREVAWLIEEMVGFGVESSILQKLSVGRNTFVGAGAVVIKSLLEGVVEVGVPARIINETS